MDTIWTQTSKVQIKEQLNKDITTEVAIIGAGMAGVLTAYKLKNMGIKCVVLEANKIASGQTQKTTAKITAQHGHIYDRLIKQFGIEKAKQYAKANMRAIDDYKNIITQNAIECDFEILDAFVYSSKDEQALQDEVRAAQSVGIPATFEKKVNVPLPVLGAVKFENQAQFNPLKFINAIIADLEIYEDTRVLTVEGNDITTSRGKKVKASKIVFACHYPFIIRPGYYFARMHQERVYFLALENAPQLNGMYIGLNNEGYSFRNYQNYLLVGNESHRTGENTSGEKYKNLRKQAQIMFPQSKEVAKWSAQDCITTDGVPYIGQFSNDTPDWYVATGFMKWGMSTSMVAATIISDMIKGKENDCAEVFSPQRFSTKDLPQTFRDSAKATKGIAKRTLTITTKEIEDLLTESADIVQIDGEKVGVYKDVDGNIFVVDIKCPHLGCLLEWNKDEKTWDCPCHGSRFDFYGKLIDEPAQEDIHIDY